MRRCLQALSLLLAWSLATGTAAQAPASASSTATPAATPAPASSAKGRQGFVWQASRGDERLVLLATVHAAPPGLASVPADLPSLLAGAKALALEADISRGDEIMRVVQRLGFVPADAPDVWPQLPPPLRQRAQAAVERSGAPLAAAARMRPWMLMLMLTQAALARAGFDPGAGSELRLAAMAAQVGVPVVELEGTEQQLSIFARMPPPLQEAALARLLDQLDDGSALRDLAQIVQAWTSGSEPAMLALLARLEADARTHPADRFTHDDLLMDRHPAMLDHIEREAATKSPLMVAVGALHWFGPRGLLAGLRARGWTVQALP